MNVLNGISNALFDLLCAPARWIGSASTLVLLSGVFGVLALLAFKHLSFQKRILAAKNRIKGHLIEIRIYQDDLVIVGKAIGRVLARNLQYLGLNFLPIVPLALPFCFVAAQLVTRFAFAPLPVHGAGQELLAGQGTTITVELDDLQAERVSELRIEYPPGVEPVSPLVRAPFEGMAYQEVVVRAPGRHELVFTLGAERQTKLLVAGGDGARVQPERGQGFVSALLWPAEPTLPSGSAFVRLSFDYPERELAAWLPAGPGGVLLVFLVASMLFGAVAMKPLKVQI